MAAVTLRLILALILVLAFTNHASAKDKKKLSAVEDMRYGVALYYYYQGDYMQALTELLIAKERGGIKGHGDNPEIMEGGFSLGYGLERHASDIFERLLENNRSRQSQDAAWFFLSKLRYLRADYAGARVALEKVRDRPNVDIRDEVYAHQINLAIREDDLDSAVTLLRKRNPGKDWEPYLFFNIGAAYSRRGEFDTAIKYFEKLAKEKYPTDELRALYDKAMTSSGYVYLMNEQYEKAIEQFSRVRLTSALSNRALLGYGWAAANLGEFKQALKPWQHLAQSSLVDENSQEALIAVPYAYEKLGSEGLALENFQKAEQLFLQEMARLQSVIDGMGGSQLLDALKIERSSGLDWLKHVRENQVSPQLGYLAELFSREDFQGVVQELRDLVGLREDFLAWEETLEFYDELTVERERGRAQKADELAAQELSLNIKKMKAQRSRLARKIESIAADKDYFALASAEEKDLIDRVLRAQKRIELLRPTDPFLEDNEEAVRRYYGILYFEASENFSDRLWRAIKTLNLLDKTLATVTKNHEKVQFLIDNPQDLDPLQARMQKLDDRLDIMAAQIDLMIDKTQDDLRRQTVDVLYQQRERLNHYIAQSRLSIARLYDKSLQESLQVTVPDDENTEASPQNGAPEVLNNSAGSSANSATDQVEGETEKTSIDPVKSEDASDAVEEAN